MTRRASRLATLAGASLTLWVWVAAAAAQPPPGDPDESTPDTAQKIEDLRAGLAEEMEGLRVQLSGLAEADPKTAPLRANLELRERIDGVYLRWREQIERAADLARRREDLERRVASGYEAVIGSSPPYTLSQLDALEASWQGASMHEADLQEMARVAEEVRDQRAASVEDKSKARRELEENEPDESQPFEVEQHAADLSRARLEVRLAEARLELARAEVENAEAELELHRFHSSVREETVGWARERVRYDSADLEQSMVRLDELEARAREALDRAKVELATAQSRLSRDQANLDAASPEAGARLEARRLARLTAERQVSRIDRGLERILVLRELAQHRHQLLLDAPPRSKLLAWEDDASAFVVNLNRRQRVTKGRIADLERELSAVRERAKAAGGVEARWLNRQTRAFDQMIVVYRDELEAIDQARTFAERARDQFGRAGQSITLLDAVDVVRSRIAAGWETVLFVVDDRSVTAGKLITATVLFVLGFLASRIASALLGRVLRRGLSMDSGAAVAFQGLTFYLLLTLFFLLSLRTVGIPLTAFTLLGGGLAIGVGFGSQNVINNFLSGLILMIERPIKVGDIVDVDGTYGRVEHIGARSTRVHSFDNIHIIVPNSSFLEKNVVNWTLSDNLVRTMVDVGVAYGSPTRDVDRLIHRALDDHGKVMDQPEPVVLFSNFGDNALIFQAIFWLRINAMMDRRRIESDIRHRIDRLFRDAGITIAFPQRDVHLDTLAPLEVRIAPAEEAGDAQTT